MSKMKEAKERTGKKEIKADFAAYSYSSYQS
jgi:hypothetical protein